MNKYTKLTGIIVLAMGTFTMGILQSFNLIATSQPQDKKNTVNVVNQTTETVNKIKPEKIEEISPLIAKRVDYARVEIGDIEEKKFRFFVPKKFQGKTLKKIANKQDKVIALTFDDGPWPKSTEQILDILKKNQIKATFFFIGKHLENFPEIGKKVAEEGHVLGNHTWNHPMASYLSEDRVKSEVGKTAELIDKLTGMRTPLFRPPGGIQTNGLAKYIEEKKQVVVLWSSDSFDWRDAQGSLTDNVLRSATPGGIVLLHDGGGNRSGTVAALPVIIDNLKKQGYKFVTVPELLEIDAQPPTKKVVTK